MNNQEIVIRTIRIENKNSDKKYSYIINKHDLNQYELSHLFDIEIGETIHFYLKEKRSHEYDEIHHPILFDPLSGRRIIFAIQKTFDLTKLYEKCYQRLAEMSKEDFTNIYKNHSSEYMDIQDFLRPLRVVNDRYFDKYIKGDFINEYYTNN